MQGNRRGDTRMPGAQKAGRTAKTVRPIIKIYTQFTFCSYDTSPKAPLYYIVYFSFLG